MNKRPIFPRRAVVTAGMPYGNKELHFGHIGGVFIQADIFARFLRDRLGEKNVLFVSGTDCYGIAIETGYRREKENGFTGRIEDYVAAMHRKQKETLEKFQISANLFAASALGEKELLTFYTPEQLRLHFMNASLGEKSVSFEPKAILGVTGEFDTVLNEGNLVTNIFNRLVRSCFYTNQKYNDGKKPTGTVSAHTKEKADAVILAYERLMADYAFDKLFELLNVFLRDANKEWAARSKSGEREEILQLLTDMFHVVRVAVALFHPITPVGCEMIRKYLKVDSRIWDWNYIFEPLDVFLEPNHMFKFLEPRVDFFEKHPSQR